MPGHAHFDATATGSVETMAVAPSLIHNLVAWHTNATDAFLQLFDAAAASSVTLGTTTPDLVIPLVAGDGTLIGAAAIDIGPGGLLFTKGVQYAVTTTAVNATSPSAAAMLSAIVQPHGS